MISGQAKALTRRPEPTAQKEERVDETSMQSTPDLPKTLLREQQTRHSPGEQTRETHIAIKDFYTR